MLSVFQLSAQLSEQHRTHFNKQIDFINESLHGMLVAHRIYENFNQSVNKYIDLPSHTLNNINNADLPGDIFEDKEQWFYPKSPNSLYREIVEDPVRSSLPIPTFRIIEDLHGTNEFINKDRFSIEKIIKSDEVNKLGGVQDIYRELETAINYYERALVNVERYEKDLMPYYHKIQLPEDRQAVYTALLEIHYDIKSIVRYIRKNNQSGVIRVLPKIQKELNWLKICIDKIKSPQDAVELKKAFGRLREIEESIRGYLENKNVPTEYTSLGKGYFYHNIVLLTKINRYGTGYVNLVNEMFKNNQWDALHFLEEPHYLKVVYPEKVPLQTLSNPSLDKNISIVDLIAKPPAPNRVLNPIVKPKPQLAQVENINIPNEDFILYASPIKESPRNIRRTETIIVDTEEFEIELFDHLITDGDRVSINVNGDWLYMNISLEKKAKKLLIKIDPQKDNFILIHADNIGAKPPNTVGVRYNSLGTQKTFLLVTDLETSELVEIYYRK